MGSHEVSSGNIVMVEHIGNLTHTEYYYYFQIMIFRSFFFLFFCLFFYLVLLFLNFSHYGNTQFFNFTRRFIFLFIISIFLKIVSSINNLSLHNFISLKFNLDLTQNHITLKNFFFSIELNTQNSHFISTTLIIAFFVNTFLPFYMASDPKSERFFFLLNFFVFSMVFLFMSANFLLLMFFWEMIGITSFFLINHFDNRPFTFKSAFKGFSFNRISDVALLTSLIIYWNSTNSFSLNKAQFFVFLLSNNSYNFFFFKISVLHLFLFFLIISMFCKSAQFGFHFWLPDSMEAPVPASALIHSATLVSAGLFLFYKFHILFLFSNFFKIFILIWCSFTALFGAFLSFMQTDLKRILAYSTISNCGLMFVSAVTSNYLTTLNFFFLHGLSKSISFLFAGLIIILNNHNQDYRSIGTKFHQRVYYIGFYSMLIYLSAWPFTVANVLKHLLIFNNQNCIHTNISLVFILLSFVFSFLYSLKIIYYLFFSFNRYKKEKSSRWSKNLLIKKFGRYWGPNLVRTKDNREQFKKDLYLYKIGKKRDLRAFLKHPFKFRNYRKLLSGSLALYIYLIFVIASNFFVIFYLGYETNHIYNFVLFNKHFELNRVLFLSYFIGIVLFTGVTFFKNKTYKLIFISATIFTLFLF